MSNTNSALADELEKRFSSRPISHPQGLVPTLLSNSQREAILTALRKDSENTAPADGLAGEFGSLIDRWHDGKVSHMDVATVLALKKDLYVARLSQPSPSGGVDPEDDAWASLKESMGLRFKDTPPTQSDELLRERDTLRRLLAKYGDRVRMANSNDDQQVIDDALAAHAYKQGESK